MGYTSQGDPAWGDTPAEIMGEAFHKIDMAFRKELGRPVRRADLTLGSLSAISDYFKDKEKPPRKPV